MHGGCLGSYMGKEATVGELDESWPCRGSRKRGRRCCRCEGWLSYAVPGTGHGPCVRIKAGVQ